MAGNWSRIGNISGRDGVGVPQGGARGEVLHKVGDTDYATAWGSLNYEDIDGKVPASALPDISIEPYVVESEAEMLNLPAVPGRTAIRTDVGATFVLAEEPASDLTNWVEMVSRSDVTSVNGKTGAVQLTKSDLGLGNVNNTADADKPLATSSVPGLMSPNHVEELDNATDLDASNTLVRRGQAGEAQFGSVAVTDSPTANNHAVTKGYVDSEVARRGSGALSGRPNVDLLYDYPSQGVYNIQREAVGSPTIAGVTCSMRLEVEVVRSGNITTTFQTARFTGMDPLILSGGPFMGDMADAGRQFEFTTGYVLRRTIAVDRSTAWATTRRSPWRMEGSTSWMPISESISYAAGNEGFWGISMGGLTYVNSVSPGSSWRINNGMVELDGRFVSPIRSDGNRRRVADICGHLSPPSNAHMPRVGAKTSQYVRILFAELTLYRRGDSAGQSHLGLTTGSDGEDNGSVVPYSLNDMSWRVDIGKVEA